MVETITDAPLKWLIRGAVTLVFAICFVDLLLWTTGIRSLDRVFPQWAHVTPWVVALLSVLGTSILLQTGPTSRRRIWAGRGAAVLVAALTTVSLVGYAAGSISPDQVGFSPAAGVSLLALTPAVITMSMDNRAANTAWPLSVIAAPILPLVSLVTYLFDAAEMLGRSVSLGMNASTAVAIVLLVDATVAARPDRQPVAWLIARPDRRMLVRLVITFLLVPIWVAIWRLVLLAVGVHGDAVWVLAVVLATAILGLPFFVLSRRIQRLVNSQLTQSRERVEAERQRAEAVERYRILANNAVDVVVHVRGNQPVWVSPSIEAAFGWPTQQWLGVDFAPHIHGDDLDAVYGALAENAAGRAAVARFRVATADGDYRWVEGHGKPHTDAAGDSDGVIVALRIIDAQIAMERELQQARDSALALAEAKSDFVATVSHEIRSPIHAIVGFSELLERQLSTTGQSEAAEWSSRMRTEAERLTRLIEDLLDLSRLDAGRTQIASKPFQLRQLVDEVIQMTRLNTDKKNLRLQYFVDPTTSDWRTGDPDRLHQVLHNLISNAEKFTREGRIDLDVTTVSSTLGDARIRFAVTDTGPGIPGSEVERILEPFAQVWSSDADRGSGLGLPISDRLVKAMGGDGLAVASLEGHGSTFHFTIPLPESQQPAATNAASTEHSTETASPGVILVVDDNETNRMLVETQLKKLGYDCEVASNGVEALERLDSAKFDAVLMDCNMPVMDGYEATRRIRAMERATGERTPVLALTASASGSNRDACERAGMDGFLSKPIHLSTLASTISRFLGGPTAPDGGGRTPSTFPQPRINPSPPILDRARIERLADELGTSALHNVVKTFVDEMPRRLAELNRVTALQDADAVRRGAHAIRSPSAMLGAAALAEHLRVIENSENPILTATHGDLDNLIHVTVQHMNAILGESPE